MELFLSVVFRKSFDESNDFFLHPARRPRRRHRHKMESGNRGDLSDLLRNTQIGTHKKKPLLSHTFLLNSHPFSPLAMAENNQQKEAIQQDQSDFPTPQPQQAFGFDAINAGGSRPFASVGSRRAIGKREWPEVVGFTVEEAEEKIKEDMPMARFQVVRPDCFVTMDFNTGRVRLYVDDSNKVVRPPKIG
ncbi:hypothetical protein ACLOJK_012706 [Asimina triloba]